MPQPAAQTAPVKGLTANGLFDPEARDRTGWSILLQSVLGASRS
jgi:hypothetical protein